MLGALNSDRTKQYAHLAKKTDGPFVCPACTGEVILKKGPIKIHHFAHKAKSNCKHGSGESESHRKAKINIYEYLKQFGGKYLELEMEKILPGYTPDVYIKYSDFAIAFEIQKSAIGLNEIKERTLKYSNAGIYCLWLLIGEDGPEEDQERYSPSVWELWLYELYNNLYYIYESGEILAWSFEPCQLYREDGYNQDGEEFSGYYYVSKRYRTAYVSGQVELSRDFKRGRQKQYLILSER